MSAYPDSPLSPHGDADQRPEASLSMALTVADINLGHLRHNTRLLQARAGPALLMGVVKANAYGHGARRVTHVLREEGVRHFAVATVPEAVALRQAGMDEVILVLSAPLPAFLPAYVQHHLEVTVSSRAVAEAVCDTARRVGPLRVHVKVDTGMGRLGLIPEDALPVTRLLEKAPGVNLAGLWTHFADVDEQRTSFAEQQVARFETVRQAIGDAFEWIHIANSAALFAYPESYSSFDRSLVRAGLALYGMMPHLNVDLRAMMRLTSMVTHAKTVKTGTTLSYGRTWRAERRTRIATVGAGYADGYPRLLSNRAEVYVQGTRYPVAGTICMDMFMLDLGAPDGPGASVDVGEQVVLFGGEGPSAHEVATWAQTIPYELCCRISERVPRLYTDRALPDA